MIATRRAFTLIEQLVVIGIIGILVALLIPAIQAAREVAKRAGCQNNLRQLGLSLGNYQSAFNVYPFGVGADGDTAIASVSSPDNRRYSMHSQILPFLDQASLFNQINFVIPPFYPDTSGNPNYLTGEGPNETVACVQLSTFICPSDFERMPSSPWGRVNYRSCSGSSWAARAGDGMFGQSSRTQPGDVGDGVSNTAAMSERVRGHDDYEFTDMASDFIREGGPWTEVAFRAWCDQVDDQAAAALPKKPSNANSGLTWLEGVMSWTRYNHALPPGRKSCINGLTWNGVVMTANSRHSGMVNLLFGDGSVRQVKYTVDPNIWRAIGTISGGEAVSADSF